MDRGIYLGLWDCLEDVLYDFNVDELLPGKECAILYAEYTYEDYNGDAYVLFMDEQGNLYEVYGSHCSCYGLEGQWEPEPTTIEFLKYVNNSNDCLKDIIRNMENQVEEFKEGMRVVALEECGEFFPEGAKGTVVSVDSKDVDGTILVKWDKENGVLDLDGNTDWWVDIDKIAILNNGE